VIRLALVSILWASGLAAAATPVQEAQALFANYHRDLANLDRARDLLEAELEKDSQVSTMLLLSRVYFTLGDVRAATPEEKLLAYDRGREVAKRAVELAPRNPDAYFLYGANTGRWGQTKGVLRSLFLLPTVNDALRTIFELDPRHAQGHALAGNVALELPRIAGGSVEKAEEHFRKAFEVEPRYTAIRIGLARVLIRKGEYAEARKELEAVLAERAPGSIADWTIKDAPRARQLLDEIEDTQ
jgi:tetratricopeptide (TPR) repeat protein